VTAGGGGMDGMSNDIGQSILVHMNVLEHAHTQSQLNHSASIFELQSYNSSQFRVLNTNIHAFRSTLQGSLVRQRASNCGFLHSGQADTPQHQLGPLAETIPATLSSKSHTLQHLWYKSKFGSNVRQSADQFNGAEKNTNSQMKHKYWRRENDSQTIARFVREGVDSTINKIQSAY